MWDDTADMPFEQRFIAHRTVPVGPESPPLDALDLAASPLLRALADADRFGGRVVGEEVEAATRENMSVCAGSFLV